MDFEISTSLKEYLAELDVFIEKTIKPLEQKDDNIRFFDHRREYARTDWDNNGHPREEWMALLKEAEVLADEAGHYRYGWPEDMGGRSGSNLDLAVIREHLASKGLGLHCDLQSEHSIVGNNPFILIFRDFVTPQQYERYGERLTSGELTMCFGLTEPNHGSDATHLETTAIPETRDGRGGWLINGQKMWTTGAGLTSHTMVFARTSGDDGDASGITVFLVSKDHPGFKIEESLWTFNMPTDHPRVSFTDVWVPDEAVLGEIGKGLRLGQSFVHQNRIRQAAASLGAAVYCINESVKYARLRKTFGKELSANQAIQWPLVELATQVEMLRLLIRKTAWEIDRIAHEEIEHTLSDKVSMCNYWANRLCCEAADRAIQVHGGIGYSRHKAFEHIYRHHRRYRITEGSEEIQIRKIGAYLFGYTGPKRSEFQAMVERHAAARASGLNDREIDL